MDDRRAVEGLMNHPGIVSRAAWLDARKALLAKEGAFTRQRAALNTERRRLPTVRVDKDYVFDGPHGPAKLLDLFEGASSSSSTTSCSTRAGTRAAPAARSSPTTSSISAICRPGRPRSPSCPWRR